MSSSFQRGDWATFWTRRRGEKPRLIQCIIRDVNKDGTLARVRMLDAGVAVPVRTIETERLEKMIVDRAPRRRD